MQDLNDKVNNGGTTADGQLSADEWNQIPSEIQNAIVSAGLALSGGDLSQLVKSISQYSTVGDFFTGAGIADAYTASAVSPAIAPPAFKDGMSIRYIVPATNTGASTLNAFTLGVVDIKLLGGVSDPVAGAMTLNDEITLIYRTAPSAHWELQVAELQASVPTASVITMPQSSVPTGYFECDGSAVSRTTYADLFAIIGILYGIGDGTTTFNLPDLRGEFIRGWDNGRGIDVARSIGTNQASSSFAFNAATSNVNAPHDMTNDKALWGYEPAAFVTGMQFGGASSNTSTPSVTNLVSTRPRNIAMMYCIKF